MLPKDCHEKQAMLLSQATEYLAKAAIALSEAAEAIAEAANSFMPGAADTGLASQLTAIAPIATEIDAIVDYESDPDISPTMATENLATPREPTNNAQHKNGEAFTRITDENCILEADGEDRLGAQSTLPDAQRNNSVAAATHTPTTEDIPQTEAKTQPFPPSYRILLDDEADVLLVVCSLIRRGRKVICYVRSSATALEAYEALLSVTKVPVHQVGSSSSRALERAVEAFQDDHTSVLLLPATDIPFCRINAPGSLVIHVGWPTSVELYQQQISHHQAENNIFVACSEDREIYPSSSNIMAHAQPWPNEKLLLEEAHATLRSSFNKKLAEIPVNSKAKVYNDWIVLHGTRGPYHPPSWTASTLAYRAKLYLLNVFKYNIGPTNASGTQIPSPIVTAPFAANQNLGAPVRERVVRVESSSGPDHIFPLSHEATPVSTIFLNGVESAKPLNYSSWHPAPSSGLHSSVASSWDLDERNSGSLNPSSLAYTSSRPASTAGSIADSDVNRPMGRVTEYLIIELAIDVVPLICYLSMQHKYKNTILFVKSLSTFEAIASMLEELIVNPVLSLKGNGPLSKNAKEALDSSGCLLLCDMYSDRPQSLNNKPIDLTIHLGWVDNPSISRSQIQRGCNYVFLLRREVQDPNWSNLAASLRHAGISKASTSSNRNYNRQTENSILAPYRKQWNEVLSSSQSVQSIRAAYMAWITHHYQGRHKEPGWSAVDVVTHANGYFKGLFCCASDWDALQDRPAVTPGFVKHLDLGAAVNASILTVKE